MSINQKMKESKIALIHATPLAIQPVGDEFSRQWPAARCMNLLDDRLSQDLALEGSLSKSMIERMVGLAQYAKTWGARGILVTCSAFGPAIDEVKRTIGLPTLKPNEAMFDEALDLCNQLGQLGRHGRIGLLTTFEPATQSLLDELMTAAEQRAIPVEVIARCATGAMQALQAGDAEKHDALIVQQALWLKDCDVLMLGQFSMARAQAKVHMASLKPVLTSPDSAVRRLLKALA
jgi:Asp/Glu/hydantoin racemase